MSVRVCGNPGGLTLQSRRMMTASRMTPAMTATMMTQIGTGSGSCTSGLAVVVICNYLKRNVMQVKLLIKI